MRCIRSGTGSASRKKLPALELGELPAKTLEVGHNALKGFLERDKDARLIGTMGAVSQKLHGEYRLPRARSSNQKRGSAAGQASCGDLVKSGNSGRHLD
jgi:hypothetical protein